MFDDNKNNGSDFNLNAMANFGEMFGMGFDEEETPYPFKENDVVRIIKTGQIGYVIEVEEREEGPLFTIEVADLDENDWLRHCRADELEATDEQPKYL